MSNHETETQSAQERTSSAARFAPLYALLQRDPRWQVFSQGVVYGITHPEARESADRARRELELDYLNNLDAGREPEDAAVLAVQSWHARVDQLVRQLQNQEEARQEVRGIRDRRIPQLDRATDFERSLRNEAASIALRERGTAITDRDVVVAVGRISGTVPLASGRTLTINPPRAPDTPLDVATEAAAALHQAVDDMAADLDRRIDSWVNRHSQSREAPFLGLAAGTLREIIRIISDFAAIPEAILTLPSVIEELISIIGDIKPELLLDPRVVRQVFEAGVIASGEAIIGPLATSLANAEEAARDGNLAETSASITQATLQLLQLILIVRHLVRFISRAPRIVRTINRRLRILAERTRRATSASRRLGSPGRVPQPRPRPHGRRDIDTNLDRPAGSRGGVSARHGGGGRGLSEGQVGGTSSLAARATAGGIGQVLQISRSRAGALWQRALTLGPTWGLRMESWADAAEAYVRVLIMAKAIRALRNVVEVVPGRIGRGKSGKDFWAFRRAPRGRRGPVSAEVKKLGPNRHIGRDDVEPRSARGQRSTRQASPEGDVEDWKRFVKRNPQLCQRLVDDGLLDERWLKPKWVDANGYEWFSDRRNRFLMIVSKAARAGVTPEASRILRLARESVIRIDTPEGFPQ